MHLLSPLAFAPCKRNKEENLNREAINVRQLYISKDYKEGLQNKEQPVLDVLAYLRPQNNVVHIFAITISSQCCVQKSQLV